MARRTLPVIVVLALGLAWTVRSDEPPAAPAPVQKGDLTLKKETDARKFREFQQSLLRLAQRLENSNKPEDKERAANIRKAIELASTSGVDTRFDRLIGILKNSKDLNLEEVSEAMAQNKMLVDDIRAILALLLSDNRDERLKEEQKRLEELIKQINKAIRDEKMNRARTEGGRTDKRDLGEAERKNIKEVGKIAKAMQGKQSEDKQGKSKKGKSGDSKNGKSGDSKKGDGKSGEPKKGDGKSGESKKGDSKKGKSGDSKSGEGKSGQQGGRTPDATKKQKGKKSDQQDQQQKQKNQPAEDTPGRKQVEEAQKFQRQAEEEIDREKRDDASKAQSKAIEELEKARKKLEEILRQLREEEIERLLATLQAMCERMLQMQIAVYNGTVQVDKAFGPAANKESESNRGNVQKAIDLAKHEGQLIEVANKAIQLLETEGSAVAFPEVFHQIRDDMKNVERRLGRADVGSITQLTETDIINTLKDMIEALKKLQQDQQNRKNNPQSQSQNKPPDQKLIDLIQELKMIRAMQVRVNSRTHAYGEQYTGEQAAQPEIQKELTNLAERQRKIFKVTNNIWKGENK